MTTVIRTMLAVLLLATGVAIAPASPVAAQEDRVYETPDQCIEAKPVEVDPYAWSCYGTDGAWRSRINEDSAAPGISSGPSFSGFLTFALFWSLIPFLLAMAIASQRDESRGGAVLLTLVLGWAGLAVVYFGQRRARHVVEGLATRVAPPDSSPALRSDSPSSPADVSPEERLRRLERLRVDKLVTESEYQDRRREILGSL